MLVCNQARSIIGNGIGAVVVITHGCYSKTKVRKYFQVGVDCRRSAAVTDRAVSVPATVRNQIGVLVFRPLFNFAGRVSFNHFGRQECSVIESSGKAL